MSVPVDGHVQRQEEDEEQVAEDAEAGDGDVAERFGQLARAVLEVVQQQIDLVVEADLAGRRRSSGGPATAGESRAAV